MKKISRDEYLRALGLWHLAHDSYKKFEEYDTAMNKVLGEEEGLSHASDSIWTEGDSLDAALERMDIQVEE